LIGEHIDYNEGFVLPMAIPLFTIMVGRENKDSNKMCRVKSLEKTLNESNYVEFSLSNLVANKKPLDWSNYIIGVTAFFQGIFLDFKLKYI
jgi:galactokinase